MPALYPWAASAEPSVGSRMCLYISGLWTHPAALRFRTGPGTHPAACSTAMRKAVFGAGIAALIALLYVIAGYWIAPRLVRDALVDEAARRGIELRVEKVR